MTHHGVRRDARRLPDGGEGDHHGPQRGLHHVGRLEAQVTGEDIVQGPVHERGQSLGALVQPGREHRRGLRQLTAHAQPLRALAGEDERHAAGAGRGGRSRHQVRGRAAGGRRREAGGQLLTLRADDDRAVLEGRPRRRQGPGHVSRVQVRAGHRELPQAAGLTGQGVRRPAGDEPGDGLRARQHRRDRFLVVAENRALDDRGLLDEHVRVGAADPEGGHARAARCVTGRPRLRLGQQTVRCRRTSRRAATPRRRTVWRAARRSGGRAPS